MPLTIHLVRHAQGFHNLSRENETLRDPELTDFGRQQCAELRAMFPHHDRITRLYASPLRRTLSTCLLAFGCEDEDGNKSRQVVAIPELQEVSDAPCDTGSDARVLEEAFVGLVDLSYLYDGWNSAAEWTTWNSKLEATEARARKARTVLRELTQNASHDEHVVVVTHGAFLHFLTNDYHGVSPLQGNDLSTNINRRLNTNHAIATGWNNIEYRSYYFADSDSANSDGLLIETTESWERREGRTVRPSKNEQELLKKIYYQQLEPYVTPAEHARF